MNTLNYHYSDDLPWYIIWIVIPLITSISIAVKLQPKFIKQAGYILLPLLIFGTYVGSYLNHQYWGYSFKRPSVFHELKDAQTIFTISNINMASDESKFSNYLDSNHSKTLYGREDLYNGTSDRAIMTFEDRANHYPDLYEWYKISKDTTKKIRQTQLNLISNVVKNSNLLVHPQKGYEGRGDRFNGKLIEFYTKNKITYYFLSFVSGEVSNDHYPVYEILLEKTNSDYKIVKSQIFYKDFAGIEGLEYSNLAGISEFILLLATCIILLISYGIKLLVNIYKLKSEKQSTLP